MIIPIHLAEPTQRESAYYCFYTDKFIEKEPHHQFPDNHIGIGLSGGGYRASAAATGQLRALADLNLLGNDSTSYIPCTSGGCFPQLFIHHTFPSFKSITPSTGIHPSKMKRSDPTNTLSDLDILSIFTSDADIVVIM